jgi:uncharacterized membrane protein (UPF0127 family)
MARKIISPLCLVLLLTGLTSVAQGSSPNAPPTIAYDDTLTITTPSAQHTFNISLAQSPKHQARGLMHQTAMPKTAGMLFDFTTIKPTIHTMWMKNTPLPLDIVFITKEGLIDFIITDTTPHSLTHLTSGTNTSAVLELHAGTSKRLNITIGSSVKHSIFNK